MLRSIGTTEWVIIAIVVILLFGGKKIPEFFKGLGDALNEFRRASKDSDKDSEKT